MNDKRVARIVGGTLFRGRKRNEMVARTPEENSGRSR